MATFQVPWLNGEMSLNIPAENIETVVRPRELAVLGDPIPTALLMRRAPLTMPSKRRLANLGKMPELL